MLTCCGAVTPGRDGLHGPRALPAVLTGALRCNCTCSRPPPHRRGRLFCLGGSAQWRVHGPQARSGAETHDLCVHNVKAALSAVSGSVEQGGGPLSARWGEAQAPQASGMHGRRRHVEYPTVADAVIEAAKKLSRFPRQKYF